MTKEYFTLKEFAEAVGVSYIMAWNWTKQQLVESKDFAPATNERQDRRIHRKEVTRVKKCLKKGLPVSALKDQQLVGKRL
jgi:hypothetical protein